MEFNRVPPEPAFAPVTITLNSQGEVNLMKEVFGMMCRDLTEKFGITEDVSWQMYTNLSPIATPCPSLAVIEISKHVI